MSGFLFEEDHDLYLLWNDGQIARLNDNVTDFEGPIRQLTTEDGTPMGSGGVCLIKADHTYIWTAGQWHGDNALNRTYAIHRTNHHGPAVSRTGKSVDLAFF